MAEAGRDAVNIAQYRAIPSYYLWYIEDSHKQILAIMNSSLMLISIRVLHLRSGQLVDAFNYRVN